MRFLIIAILLSATSFSYATDNTIFLHNGKMKTEVPAEWVVIAHNPAGNRTTVAFQIIGNPAEKGTPDSTNLAITAYYLKDTETIMAFVKPLTEKPKTGESVSEFQGWSLREWQGKQGETEYRILDASITNEKLAIGIQVRLAWPLLDKNPNDYDSNMKKILTELLLSINKLNSDKAE